MPAKTTRKKNAKRKATPGESPPRIAFWRDPRFRKVIGLCFLLLAIFLVVALGSYLANFAADHDRVHGRGFGMVFDGAVHVNNALGRFGAWVAHQLVYLRFGLPAFLLAFCSMAVGANLLYAKRLFPLGKVFLYSGIAMVWTCTALTYVFGERSDWLGGGLGRYLAGGLSGALGGIGTGILLAFVLLAVAVLFFNAELQLPMGRLMAFLPAIGSKTTQAAVPASSDGHIRQAPTYRSAEEVEASEKASPILRPRKQTDASPGESKLTLEVNQAQNDPDNDPNGREDTTAQTDKLPTEQDSSIAETSSEASSPADPTETDAVAPKNGAVDNEGWTVAKSPVAEKSHSGEVPELDITDPIHEKIDAERGSLESHYDPTLELPDYRYPTLELLEDYGSSDVQVNTEELERNKDQIIETLDNYGIQISKIKATIGPTVTLYEIVPAKGVRISKIKNLEDDIALSLSALGIRIIAPIPGKGTVGIEVPNVNKTIVGMKGQLGSEKFTKAKMDLPICLGKTISGENYVADLARMPHLLMAGATGQGKSVGINAILVSLLYKKHPSELKFVLVDPKKVELALFDRIEKHFLAKMPGDEEAIITDVRNVVKTLNALCIEMDQRYDVLKKAHTRNITEYNAKFLQRRLNPQNGHRFLPFIVLVIDEFADLIMTAGKEVEMPLARLAQLARAVGIHLVIATQRPSVNIITGLIKANFPARIAFKVTSKVDSRTILDSGGADQLIGRGDMLLSIGSDVVRLQCPFVDTPEVEKVADFIGQQKAPSEAFLLPEYLDERELQAADDFDGERDVLFSDAARVIVQNQQGSTSLIQRRLKLGYNRAGRLMDQLEAAGVVGPNLGSKARDVLIIDEMELERILEEST